FEGEIECMWVIERRTENTDWIFAVTNPVEREWGGIARLIAQIPEERNGADAANSAGGVDAWLVIAEQCVCLRMAWCAGFHRKPEQSVSKGCGIAAVGEVVVESAGSGHEVEKVGALHKPGSLSEVHVGSEGGF